MKIELMTDEQVEAEIQRLSSSEEVKLARMETRIKNRRRQLLYTLRSYEKRGCELISKGYDEYNMESRLGSAGQKNDD